MKTCTIPMQGAEVVSWKEPLANVPQHIVSLLAFMHQHEPSGTLPIPFKGFPSVHRANLEEACRRGFIIADDYNLPEDYTLPDKYDPNNRQPAKTRRVVGFRPTELAKAVMVSRPDLAAGGKTKAAITADEANKAAMKLAKQDPAFVIGGVRDWAAAIRGATGKTCSIATIEATRLWRETMKVTGRGRTRGKAPKAVALTDNMESVVGEGGKDEVLKKLIAQQDADYEPSPIDDDPPAKRRKPKHFGQV